MKIIILGDIGASKLNEEAFCNAEKDLFSDEIQNICKNADIVLLNLEKPLTNEHTPLGKCPPDFSAPTDTINGIRLLNPTAVTLANNHIMDQRVLGLRSTIQTLVDNGIQYVGVGANANEARKPLVLKKNGYTIGVYACCEKEFSFATEYSAGANAYDPLVTFDDIEELKQSCDYLIILFHGGLQGFPYPTPQQQRVCRKMCEKGADIVICQHSHIVGCEEDYAGGKIIYGQGNFLLDEIDTDSWRTGVMVEITFNANNYNSIQCIPVETKEHKVYLSPNTELVLDGYNRRSEELRVPSILNEKYKQYCVKRLPDYLLKLSGTNILLQKVLRRSGMKSIYIKHRFNESYINRLADYLYCDTHREAIETGIAVVYGGPVYKE